MDWLTSSRASEVRQAAVESVDFSSDAQYVATNSEQPPQLGGIGGAIHRSAQHRLWHEQFARECISFLLCDDPATMHRSEEVVAQLVRDGEPLAHGRLGGIDLDYIAYQSSAERPERLAHPDRKAEASCDCVNDDRRPHETVRASHVTRFRPCVGRVRTFSTCRHTQLRWRLVIDAYDGRRLAALNAIGPFGQVGFLEPGVSTLFACATK
jgi:hypothetical protein